MTSHDGDAYPARRVGVDRANDLAVLHVDADGLRAVRFGQSDAPIGAWVLTVGPEAAPRRIGMISARPRRIAPRQLVLGVMLAPDREGLVVRGLTPGHGAQRAGVAVGDVVTHVMGEKVIAIQQVVAALQEGEVGARVQITVLRGGAPLELSVELSELSPDPRGRDERMNRMGGRLSGRNVGFQRVLQHDTEIRPADCGGALVNLAGEVIGINIARAGRIETYALPAELVLESVRALIEQDTGPAAAEAEAGP